MSTCWSLYLNNGRGTGKYSLMFITVWFFHSPKGKSYMQVKYFLYNKVFTATESAKYLCIK